MFGWFLDDFVIDGVWQNPIGLLNLLIVREERATAHINKSNRNGAHNVNCHNFFLHPSSSIISSKNMITVYISSMVRIRLNLALGRLAVLKISDWVVDYAT